MLKTVPAVSKSVHLRCLHPLPQQQPQHPRSSRRFLVCNSSKTDGGARAGTAASESGAQQQQQAPNVECVATGMDVACYVSDDEQQQQSMSQQQTQTQQLVGFPASNGNGNGKQGVPEGQHVDCVATGMDVQCFITDDDDSSAAASSTSATTSTKKAAPTTAAAPRTAAAAAASGEGGPLMQLLGVALLVSPFFFWGTSMVALKV